MTLTRSSCLAGTAMMLFAAMYWQTANASTSYVAPDPTVGLSAKNQAYLIGVVSFAVVVIAGILGVASMVNIDYDDDTLLMVEVPEDVRHEEQS